jgi:signal peptidase II
MALGAWGRVALVAAGVVALDQATKALVRSRIADGDRVHVIPGVELVHTRNTGVAFGALSGGGAIVTIVVALALVALGFPAFNVADMSITFGVIVLLFVIEHDAGARDR